MDNRGVEQLFPSGEAPDRDGAVPPAERPLAARMRPRSLEEVVGQGHLLSESSALALAIREGRPHSMVLYGPPGTGKTTIARLLATNASAAFEEASAVSAGRQQVREMLERAEHRRAVGREGTLFFLDEIHRFNKAQQDTLLPAVEEGLVVLVGATTENPYFEVNSALLSRTRVYELRALAESHVLALLERALTDPRGLSDAPAVDEDALRCMASSATAIVTLPSSAFSAASSSAASAERASPPERAARKRSASSSTAGASGSPRGSVRARSSSAST